jgi:hypothetical protein
VFVRYITKWLKSGLFHEFGIIRLNGKPCFVKKALVDCIEPPCKEFCSLCGIIKLGSAVLVGLLKFVNAFLIVLLRSRRSSEMHLKAAIPRKDWGLMIGSTMYFWFPPACTVLDVLVSGVWGVVPSGVALIWHPVLVLLVT